MDELLTAHQIRKAFGATQALRGVSFTVRKGEILALVGENGAGKSTLMKVLSGAHRADAGHMTLEGNPFAPSGPLDARLAGVAMIYQELSLAPDLSVEDNIMLGREHGVLGWHRRSTQRALARAALDRLGQQSMSLSTAVRRLSTAQRQLVEIARALACDAKLLILDEPTSSLPREDVERLFAVLRRLRQEGVGIIYISHFLDEVLQIADRYTVLRDGQSVGEGTMHLVDEAKLVSLMVGRSVDQLFPKIPHDIGEPVLRINGLTGAVKPRDASLTLHRGEILGLAGLVGAGRTELVRAIAGLDSVRSGAVQIAGLPAPSSIAGRIAQGMGMVSEDRKLEGLAQSLSIEDNTTLSALGFHSRLGFLMQNQRKNAVSQLIGDLAIKSSGPGQSVNRLSGGNQQKVALARLMHQQADILLLDEPTRGIDVGSKAEVYRRIGEWAAQGKAVLFVSSYLPELLAVCDRIAVMSRGRIREIRPTSEWNEEAIMACCVGGAG